MTDAWAPYQAWAEQETARFRGEPAAAAARAELDARAETPGPPSPKQLGLSGNPALTWSALGMTEPTPADLFGAAEGTTWGQFHSALDAAEADAAAEAGS